jgi:hypothetical protein
MESPATRKKLPKIDEAVLTLVFGGSGAFWVLWVLFSYLALSSTFVSLTHLGTLLQLSSSCLLCALLLFVLLLCGLTDRLTGGGRNAPIHPTFDGAFDF